MKRSAVVTLLIGVCLLLGGGYATYMLGGYWVKAYASGYTKATRFSNDVPLRKFYGCMSGRACKETVFAATKAYNLYLAISSFLAVCGLALVVRVVRTYTLLKLHTGDFARRKKLRSLRIANWLDNPKARYGIVLGHQLDLPEMPDEQLQILMGEARGNMDTQMLMYGPGYGRRDELPCVSVFGTSRSGKSQHLKLQLMRWFGSAVVLDVKGELFRTTAGLASKTKQVYRLRLDGTGHRFNPVDFLGSTDDGIRALAEKIVTTMRGSPSNTYFTDKAKQAVSAVLYGARALKRPPFDFITEVLRTGEMTTFVASLMSVDDDKTTQALNLFLAPHGGPGFNLARAMTDRALMSVWGTMTKELGYYTDENVRYLLRCSDFSPQDLMETKTYVYLNFSTSQLKSYSPVYNLIMSTLIDCLEDHVNVTLQGGKPKQRVLLGLDELYFAPVADLPHLYSHAAGLYLTPILYCQSPKQLEQLYGKDGGDIIDENSHVTLFYKCENMAAAERISRMSGRKTYFGKRRSHRGSGQRDVMDITETREVLSPAEALLVGGEKREVILARVSGKPLIALKRAWPFGNERIETYLSYDPPELGEPAKPGLRSEPVVDGYIDEAPPILHEPSVCEPEPGARVGERRQTDGRERDEYSGVSEATKERRKKPEKVATSEASEIQPSLFSREPSQESGPLAESPTQSLLRSMRQETAAKGAPPERPSAAERPAKESRNAL